MPDDREHILAERALTLPADKARLDELIDALEAFGIASDTGGRETWNEFLTAVIEIGSNILVYAYRDREPGQVELRLLRFPDRLEARFRDWGAPFEEAPGGPAATNPADATDPEAILALAESGRGLPLARAALSSFTYDRTANGENHWRLTKTL